MSAKPTIVCFGLARQLHGKALEYYDPAPASASASASASAFGTNAMFTIPFFGKWISHLQKELGHSEDGPYFYVWRGWKGHIYRKGEQWCAIATNIPLAALSVSNLAGFMLNPANDLETIAVHFQNLLPGEKIAGMHQLLDETRDSLKASMAKLLVREEHLAHLVDTTRDLELASKDFYVATTDLNSYQCPWWFPTSLIPSCSLL